MSRRTMAILVASHLLLAAIGAGIAWRAAGGGISRHPFAATKHGKPETAAGKASAFQPTRDWGASEWARAWKAVRNGTYTTRERIKLQRDLLEKWAELDLAAAIEAAMGEAWDRDAGGYEDPCGPLLDVFSAALAKHPQEGWDMIRGRQFGVGTGMLRRVWMQAVGMADPLFLAKRLAELSWRDRGDALEICHAAIEERPDAATQAELFRIFAALPEDIVSAEQLIAFTSLEEGPVDRAAVKEEIVRLGAGDRMARVKAMLLGRELAAHSAAAVAEEIEGLPEGVRQEVVWAAFKDAEKPENVLGLADLLIDGEAWAKVEQVETVQQLQRIAADGAAAAVADWALSLPVRMETTELFHRGVETYLAEDLEAARTWLEQIPPGVWRDRAHAEYSQVALNAHADTRSSRWALNRIDDKDFKREAEDWRAQWERRTGWTRR